MALNAQIKGIMWVNNYNQLNPLNNSGTCAEDFYATLLPQGIPFNGFKRGDSSALNAAVDTDLQEKKQFSSSSSGIVYYPPGEDSIYAETVDMLYFCGHGDPSGVYFGQISPLAWSDYTARYDEILLGDGRMKWLVLDACQVLENTVTAGNNSIFNRWVNSFKPGGGLRYIFGFHSACKNDNFRGKIFAEKLNPIPGGSPNGELIRLAWRFACEQTDNAEWAILRVGDAVSNIADDRWTDQTLPDVPSVPAGGTQKFTYQKRVGPAANIIDIIS